MSNSKIYFDKNKYVVLNNVLNEEVLSFLVKHLFKLKQEGLTTKDDQCPLSDSVYGDEIFDNLLDQMAKSIGENVGKKLIPAYSYARIYRKGEVLKKHVDRKSCEISATITLGYDAGDSESSWPIYFDEEKEIPIFLEPGEMVVYRGCEVVHWRPKFLGEWQAQLFLHYVDADGPNVEWALDKRRALGQKEKTQDSFNNVLEQGSLHFSNSVIIAPQVDNYLPGFYCIDSKHLPELMFTKDECDNIISLTETMYPEAAAIGDSESNLNRDIRSVNLYSIKFSESTSWIFSKISSIVSIVNNTYFKYNIAGITHGLQLLEYSDDLKVKGHYDWHVDCGTGHMSTRKISISIQLSDTTDYEGCDVLINNYGTVINASREKGSISLFPSFLLHKVSSIEKGKRYALVIWIHGSDRFK